MTDVVIVEACRTAIGAFGGQLSNIPASDLGAVVVRSLLAKSGVQGEDVSEVIFGNVLQAGQGMNVARQIGLKAGLPVEVPGMTVNKVCGSGLKSIVLAAQAVAAGAGIVVAGGVENMDMAPYLVQKGRYGYRMGHAQLVDCMLKDGLWCAITDTHMGLTAENVAEKWGITREAQDKYAAASHNRAEAAITSHRFEDEIVPVEVPVKRDEKVSFRQDEHPRFGTTEASLARLKPAFKQNGTVTAGNASGINDGAAAVLVMSAEKASELDLKPMARIRSFASAGVAPEYMGMGPVPATKKALDAAGLDLKDRGGQLFG